MTAETDERSRSDESPSGPLERIPYRTPWGTGMIVMLGPLLLSVELPLVERPDLELPGPAVSYESASESRPVRAERWVTSLEAYFSGERLGWTLNEVPLEELDVGRFERNVYGVLLSVPPAMTVSYGTLAEMAGYPRAARAVGNAMAANPWPVIIPCHRVIRSDGTLGRYGTDPAWKPRLLEHEAAHLERRS